VNALDLVKGAPDDCEPWQPVIHDPRHHGTRVDRALDADAGHGLRSGNTVDGSHHSEREEFNSFVCGCNLLSLLGI
jgi:hypothetical protein